MNRPTRIVSGGQTGADQGALEAAKQLGIGTGGMMPRGYRTEAGPRPDFAGRYSMGEHDAEDYAGRTEANVLLSDGTLVITGADSTGTQLTIDLCRQYGKPILVNPSAPIELSIWVETNAIGTLNVAGPRESEEPGIGERVRTFLLAAFSGRSDQ